ncbi:MAG: hypothetical protein IJX80_09890 [Clostridia bacterium]|nr:hypothetical protein [Clostridia bacterium]
MGTFDKDQFTDRMGSASSLTLEEYCIDAEASSVRDFYYTLTAYFNGSDAFVPVSTESEGGNDADTEGALDGSLEDDSASEGFPGGMIGGMRTGDFTFIGYSSDSAMTDFASGITSITSGAVFDEGTEDCSCIISEELATYNSLAVGDVITISSANKCYELIKLSKKAGKNG